MQAWKDCRSEHGLLLWAAVLGALLPLLLLLLIPRPILPSPLPANAHTLSCRTCSVFPLQDRGQNTSKCELE